MRNSYTSYLSSVEDDILVSQIKSVFQRESENQRPSRNVMQFLLGYAAAQSKEMIWREGDEQYYPSGVTDPNYCVLKFTATDGRFYSDFFPRSFVLP